MMQAERMSTVSLIVPKKQGKKVIETLHDMQIYHIQDHRKGQLDIGAPLPNAEAIAGALVKARSLQSQTKEQNTKKKKQETYTYSEQKIIEKVEKIHASFSDIRKKEENIKEKRERIEEAEKNNTLFSTLGVSLATLHKESNHLTTLFGTVQQPLENINNLSAAIYQATVEKKQYVVVVVKKDQKEQAQKVLLKSQFQEIHLPEVQEVKKSEKETLTKEQKAVAKEKQEWMNEHADFLAYAVHALDTMQDKAEVPLRFGASEYTLFIKGWVPTRNLHKVQKKLEEVTKGAIAFDADEATGKEIPILLKNNKTWKPFEFFLELFALPGYKEIDPSFLLFLTFPLFFAIMLGDVGYGIVTLLLFTFLRKKMPSAKALLTIMMYASLVTIAFGGLYGEYFGYEHLSEETGHALCENTGICLPKVMEAGHGDEHGEAAVAVHYIYDFPRVINRVHGHINIFGMELLSVLVIGALIGFIHVNLGIALGFYNIWKAHGFKHALYEKASWWFLQGGLILMVLGYMRIGFQPWVGASIAVIGAVMLYLGEGIVGIVEIPGIFSNMLSYMRLGAVGLASVGLAVVVNENLVAPMMEQGGMYIIAGIAIFTLGHVINIALGIIGPFLHSLRLHYVEFFTKFYKGGGLPFQPFGKKEINYE